MHEMRKPMYLAVARLGAIRGLKGELRLISYSGEFSHIAEAGEILVGGSLGLEDARTLKVQQVLVGGWGASIVFEGYRTPEKARQLVGRELFLPRGQACPKKKGEYYVADLVGMIATVDGARVGVVAAVLEGGADDLLEITRDSGGTALVPFRREFVGEVDEEKGEFEIVSPWILE
ncbi:MAG: ribosome maturation factor RimM [Rectinema sp.]